MKHTQYLLLTYLLFIFSCDSESIDYNNDPLTLDEFEFIDDYPIQTKLYNQELVDLGQVGIRSIFVHDSILYISGGSSKGLWSLYSLPRLNYLGGFLSRGKGPFEFNQLPSVFGTRVNFIERDNSVLAYITTFSEGLIYEFNITQTLQDDKLSIRTVKSGMPSALFNSLVLDSTTFFYKEHTPKDVQQLRKLIKKDNSIELPILNQLNKAEIRSGEDFNLLTTIIRYNQKHERIVEAPIFMNRIQIYSLDGTFAKTLFIDDKVLTLKNIQDTWEWNRLYTFSCLGSYQDFFGVVLKNIDAKNDQFPIIRGKMDFPKILIFDWDGNPIAQLELDVFIDTFTIDMKNETLYTFNNQTEEIFKFNIQSLLSEIRSISHISK